MAACGAGLRRTVMLSYTPALYTACAACLVAALAVMAVMAVMAINRAAKPAPGFAPAVK